MTKNVNLRLLDWRNRTLTSELVNQEVPRAALDIEKAISQIQPLLDEVRTQGQQALINSSLKFDGVDPTPIRVPKSEIDVAENAISAELRKSLAEAIDRVFKVSTANKPAETRTQLGSGAIVRQRWQPVDSVGLYVPGGKAVYPSSVVMNVVPAQVAGVKTISIATPPQKNGRPHPTVLATAGMLGIDSVYCMGGASAVAAFAYGVKEIALAPVSLVTGPGNIFVAAAKRALRGAIGIDAEAGTTEILVLADEFANARLIAYDLVSQAEHDEAAASVLVTNSIELAHAVNNEIVAIASKTLHTERVSTALNGVQSAIVVVSDLSAAAAFANFYATEHLELHTEDNETVLKEISNAGAIFLGANSPVSLGDYLAGSSHVLPTGGQAKFGSGLGVHSFLRAQQIIDYDRAALLAASEPILTLSAAEGLPAHGEAVQARFE